jgi:hypothetical protein
MSEIPLKVAVVASLEMGLTIGLAVVTYYSMRVIVTATRQHRWQGWREL